MCLFAFLFVVRYSFSASFSLFSYLYLPLEAAKVSRLTLPRWFFSCCLLFAGQGHLIDQLFFFPFDRLYKGSFGCVLVLLLLQFQLLLLSCHKIKLTTWLFVIFRKVLLFSSFFFVASTLHGCGNACCYHFWLMNGSDSLTYFENGG